jgi:hypothetical protein
MIVTNKYRPVLHNSLFDSGIVDRTGFAGNDLDLLGVLLNRQS